MARPSGVGGVILMGAVVLAGCSGSRGPMSNPVAASGMTGTSTTYASNGERIYFTAVSSSGTPISYSGGFFSGMGRLTCAMCHGPGGHGGSTTMMGAIVQAPDITWPALTGADPDMEHPPYTDQTVRAAITDGVDPGGQPLDQTMPRWTIAPNDLDDLVSYLKTLQ